MKILICFLLFIQSCDVLGQQRVICFSDNSYHMALIDSNYRGKVLLCTTRQYTKNGITSCCNSDTISFFSNEKGLFNSFDTAMQISYKSFSESDFEYNVLSQELTNKIEDDIIQFDTSYSYEKDNYTSVVLFCPKKNYLIHQYKKNADTFCRFETKMFDGKRRIKYITSYNHKNKCAESKNLFQHINNLKPSDIYEFVYSVKGKPNNILAINYYRVDEKNGRKKLYASNKYLYSANGKLQNAIFTQDNGVAKLKRTTIYKYLR